MIQVLLTKTETSLGIEIKGHSPLGEKGQNILCAAVSSMAQMMEIGINNLLGLKKKSKKKKVISF